jgi:hypothetical protein
MAVCPYRKCYPARMPLKSVSTSSIRNSPATGSVLSLAILYRHVALGDPREALRLLAPSSFADDAGLRPVGTVSALPTAATLRFSWGVLFRGLTTVRSRYDLSICSPRCRSDQVFTQPTGLLLPGFRRLGHPHRRRISLQWQLGKFH